ncbi:uncharacterized protein proser2 [Brachyhypopomus gauderio]|uniref:uncharacterized protein proser2 n=1 Tax=Brachyhypopomus gauderio TaxID=698409 RepID=UPI0040415447
MDFHVHSNPRLHYGLNGSMSHHSKDDALQFLSLEEKECILFFEETIDSLQTGLEDDSVASSSGRVTAKEHLRTSASSATHRTPTTALSPSQMDHDIIDLVHSSPHFTTPDFQSQAKFEGKPTRDSMAFPDPTLSAPSAVSDSSEESNYHPPPGYVPTPVVIASRLAEHQSAGVSPSLPSMLLQRRRSMEAQRNQPSKCGPPTHAKPARLPDNICMTRGGCDPSPHSIAVAAVNLQERRSQMLANLPPNAHPLEGGEPNHVRSTPTRSVSFTDPTLNASRMEALSKLGLTGSNTAPAVTGTGAVCSKVESSGFGGLSGSSGWSGSGGSSGSGGLSGRSGLSGSSGSGGSGGLSGSSGFSGRSGSGGSSSSSGSSGSGGFRSSRPASLVINKAGRSPDIASSSAHTSVTRASNSPDTSASLKNSSVNAAESGHSSSYEQKPKSEIGASNFNIYGGKSAVITAADPPAVVSYNRRSSAPVSAASAEVSHRDFNNYGGKTIMLNPIVSSKSEPVSDQRGASGPPVKQEPADTQFNSYGIRSKVITPSTVHAGHSPTSTVTARTSLGDLDSPTGSRSSVFPLAKAEGQSKAQSPKNSHEARPSHPDPVPQPVVRARPPAMQASPAPRPPRPTSSQSVQRPHMPPEVLSMFAPKSSLRAEGVTVQFSGKGTTEETRRDALRKLGLLRKTS